ncbi:MAG: ATP-binding cassette domain-containing protein [Candidatus Dojkabacteria bacterium]
MITVEHLCKKVVKKSRQKGITGVFKKRDITEIEILKDISFQVQEGEFVAYLGANGAGKTTSLKILAGILYPTSGNVDVFGYTPFEKKVGFKKTISFVMAQKSQLFMDLKVQDSFDFIAEIYEVDKTQYHRFLQDITERFQIADKLSTQARRLSLGQRMKCELICSLDFSAKGTFSR